MEAATCLGSRHKSSANHRPATSMTINVRESSFSSDGFLLRATITEPVPASGAVLFAHGITGDRHEDGVLDRVADALARDAYVTSLRFDFRGHGESDGKSADTTVSGEIADIRKAATEFAELADGMPKGLIACSFGAIPAAHLLAEQKADFDFAVLLNPVLDLKRQFIEAETPWSRQWFTREAVQAALDGENPIMVGDDFELSAVTVRELNDGPQPLELLRDVDIPMLVVHPRADTYVSFDIAQKFSEQHPLAEFESVDGEHGFHETSETRALLEKVVPWVANKTRSA
jgi:alpha/beta superfamily hydrolase